MELLDSGFFEMELLDSDFFEMEILDSGVLRCHPQIFVDGVAHVQSG